MRKFAKDPTPNAENAEYKSAKNNLLKEIEACGIELGLLPQEIEELKKGQRVYINGARGAIREADLDVAHYDFFQVYLSNQVHSHPVSFMRADKHEINFDKPGEFQLEICSLCLKACSDYLSPLIQRVTLFTGSVERDPLKDVWLTT